MNRFSKHLSLTIVTTSLFASINTHCMLIKKLATKPISKQYTKRMYQYLNSETTKELQRDALKAATDLITTNQNIQTTCATFTLLTALAEKNQGFEIAIDSAQKGTFHKDTTIQIEALKLFQTLVKQNQAFEMATKAATTAMTSEDYSVRYYALNLFKTLFNKNQAFEDASICAVATFENDKSDIRDSAIELFKLLFGRNRAFETGIESAHLMFKRFEDNHAKQCSALKLFNALTEQNRGFEKAIKAAAIGITSKHPNVQQSAKYLFDTYVLLIKKNDEAKS